MKQISKILILSLVVMGFAVAGFASSESTVDDGGQTVIIGNSGIPYYIDDGNQCTINLQTGEDYGPDC